MKSTTMCGVLFFAVIIGISPLLANSAFAQMHHMSPRVQWQTTSDVSQITCQDGFILLTKANGMPSCVSPSSYLRLVDRGWGMWDGSMMMNRPQMMNNLIGTMLRDPQLMQQWHDLMIQNQQQMQETRNQWIQQLKENPQLMANMMGPMTTNPELQQQMIDHMLQHKPMMQSIRNNTNWMNMMHDQMMGQGMMGGMGMHSCSWCSTSNTPDVHYGTATCAWCPVTNQTMGMGWMMHNPQHMQGMMNQVWQNPQWRQQMNDMMIQNPWHMGHMGSMMGHMMNPMMDDPEFRQQMLDMMTQNQEFMQKLRESQQFQQNLKP